MLHVVTVRHVSRGYESADLRCRVLSGIGFSAVCSCEWRGPIRQSFGSAREDRAQHQRESAVSLDQPNQVGQGDDPDLDNEDP